MRKILPLFALSLLLLPLAARGQVTNVTGTANVVSPPPSVETGTGSQSIVFAEQSGVLSFPITVDASTPGSYGFLGTGSLTPGTIAAGTDVSSFYLHSWNSTDFSGTIYSGSITFATPILGVEALDASLVATNSILGVPTTTYYPSSVGQGFEGSFQIDGFTFSGDTLSFIDETFNASDDLRIITAAPTAAPEPSGVLMLGMGLLALMVFNLKRLIA